MGKIKMLKQVFVGYLFFCFFMGLSEMATAQMLYRNELLSVENGIPKIIHFVWLGSKELSESVQQAIDSWRYFLPDWQIKRWSEENCLLDANQFVKTAYQEKRYNFASDWCRIVALKEGGVYFDTDVFLTAPIDHLFLQPLVLTYESDKDLSGGIIGVVPNHPLIEKMYNHYMSVQYPFFIEKIPVVLTRFFKDLHQITDLNGIKLIKNNKYIVYPANIMMFDFGGPENVSEHWYADGKTQFQKRGGYYAFFSYLFLLRHAYKLDNETYFIPLSNNEGYIVEKGKNKRWWIKTEDKIERYKQLDCFNRVRNKLKFLLKKMLEENVLNRFF